MSNRHSDVACHCRVGEVALQAADRQLTAEVFEQCVCHSEVTFGVLEVYRVYFMRHSR